MDKQLKTTVQIVLYGLAYDHNLNTIVSRLYINDLQLHNILYLVVQVAA